MKTYADIIDLLNFEGPGLQDFVTADELDRLLAGSLPHGVIADRYLEELDFTTVVAVETDRKETRADLLTWIGWELEVAAQQRADEVADDALAALRAHTAAQTRRERIILGDRDALIEEARENGATKDAIAKNLGISRPTLDKWIQDREDRALFNEAIFLLIRKADMPAGDERTLTEVLGIRSTSAQASVFLAGLEQIRPADLTPEQEQILMRAERRARQVV